MRRTLAECHLDFDAVVAELKENGSDDLDRIKARIRHRQGAAAPRQELIEPAAETAAPWKLPAVALGGVLGRRPHPGGKEKARRQDLAHLRGQAHLLPGADPEAYEAMYRALLRDLQPKDAIEEMLVKHIADRHWDVQRWRRIQIRLFQHCMPDALDLSPSIVSSCLHRCD